MAITTRLVDLQNRIASALANSLVSNQVTPRILAVSKQHDVPVIREAYELAGLRHFGENHVDELISKAPLLPTDINWHLIGHLQTNKCRPLLKGCPMIHMVETIDSFKLADKMQKAVQDILGVQKKIFILVQIRTSEEEESKKTGFPNISSEVVALVRHIIDKCPNLHFKGLMTIADPSPVKRDTCFDRMQQLKECILHDIPECNALFYESTFELSMGMTDDMESAIKYGSTEVRIGSGIFGKRKPKESDNPLQMQ